MAGGRPLGLVMAVIVVIGAEGGQLIQIVEERADQRRVDAREGLNPREHVRLLDT